MGFGARLLVELGLEGFGHGEHGSLNAWNGVGNLGAVHWEAWLGRWPAGVGTWDLENSETWARSVEVGLLGIGT
jgi:hypothetical protein